MALPESLALAVPKKQTISSLLIFFSFSPPSPQSKMSFLWQEATGSLKLLCFLACENEKVEGQLENTHKVLNWPSPCFLLFVSLRKY